MNSVTKKELIDKLFSEGRLLRTTVEQEQQEIAKLEQEIAELKKLLPTQSKKVLAALKLALDKLVFIRDDLTVESKGKTMKQLQFDFIDEESDIELLRKVSQYRNPTEAADDLNIPAQALFRLIQKYTGKIAGRGPSYKEYLMNFFREEQSYPEVETNTQISLEDL